MNFSVPSVFLSAIYKSSKPFLISALTCDNISGVVYTGDEHFAGVSDTGDKHKVANIPTNFRKNSKQPYWDTEGPGETDS